MIEIYCDGSCRGNGKAESEGGYAVCTMKDKEMLDLYWCTECNTTNNRMEMKALLYALDLATKYGTDKCVIYSDSAYCVNMFNDWIWSWANNGWKRAGNKEIENLDLVRKIYPYTIAAVFPGYQVERVSGHSGIIGNEIADAAATQNLTKLAKILEENNISYNNEIKFDF